MSSMKKMKKEINFFIFHNKNKINMKTKTITNQQTKKTLPQVRTGPSTFTLFKCITNFIIIETNVEKAAENNKSPIQTLWKRQIINVLNRVWLQRFPLRFTTFQLLWNSQHRNEKYKMIVKLDQSATKGIVVFSSFGQFCKTLGNGQK